MLSWPAGETDMLDEPCSVLQRPGREMVLDCPARSGMSGSPVLADRDGAWHVVGILTNRIGEDHSLATSVAINLY